MDLTYIPKDCAIYFVMKEELVEDLKQESPVGWDFIHKDNFGSGVGHASN